MIDWGMDEKALLALSRSQGGFSRPSEHTHRCAIVAASLAGILTRNRLPFELLVDKHC